MKKRIRTLNKFRTNSYILNDRNYYLIEESCYFQFIEYFLSALLSSNDLNLNIKQSILELKNNWIGIKENKNFEKIHQVINKLYEIFRSESWKDWTKNRSLNNFNEFSMIENLMGSFSVLDPVCKMFPKELKNENII